MNHEIKVLFLDIDNTLLDFDAGAAWGMEQCFQKAGLEYRTEMFSVFTEENNKIWQKIERRELTMDNLFYVRWQAILAHLGLEADGVEMEKEFRRLLHLTAVPVEGAKEILEYLYKKDYFLCAQATVLMISRSIVLEVQICLDIFLIVLYQKRLGQTNRESSFLMAA